MRRTRRWAQIRFTELATRKGSIPLVEGARGRGAAVAGGAEADALAGLGGVGLLVVVGGEQRIDVNQGGGVRQLTGAGVDAHGGECAKGR